MNQEHLLSEGEWRLMKLLWDSAPCTVSQLVEAMKDSTGWTKSTIFIMLQRLAEKGAVCREEGGARKLYYPLLEQGLAEQQETQSFLSRVYDGSLGMMVSTMVGRQALTNDDIEQLYEILARAEQEVKRGDS